MAIVVLGLAALLVPAGCGDDGGDRATFCTAEAMLGPNGESYGRSAEHGCRFVDEDGSPLTTKPSGGPICDDDAGMPVVPCG